MILSKRKCPLCGSQIMASFCGPPIWHETLCAVACSNNNFNPMPSEHGETIPMLRRSVDDLFAQGLTEDEVVDKLALEYIRKLQEEYGEVARDKDTPSPTTSEEVKSCQKPITSIPSCSLAGYFKACAEYWKDVKPGIWVYKREKEE